MGIYPNHGLEYLVAVKTWIDEFTIQTLLECIQVEYDKTLRYDPRTGLLTVISMKESDTRLEQSTYYVMRESGWFSPQHFSASHIRPIEEPECKDVDIKLTEVETSMLQYILFTLGNNVVRHGWYDVNYLCTTY